jgi:hypothetical protein
MARGRCQDRMRKGHGSRVGAKKATWVVVCNVGFGGLVFVKREVLVQVPNYLHGEGGKGLGTQGASTLYGVASWIVAGQKKVHVQCSACGCCCWKSDVAVCHRKHANTCQDGRARGRRRVVSNRER